MSSRQRRGRSRHDSCATPRRFGPACLKEGRRTLVANSTLAQGSVGRVPALPGKRPICGVSCRRRPWALTHSTRLELDLRLVVGVPGQLVRAERPWGEGGRLGLQVPGARWTQPQIDVLAELVAGRAHLRLTEAGAQAVRPARERAPSRRRTARGVKFRHEPCRTNPQPERPPLRLPARVRVPAQRSWPLVPQVHPRTVPHPGAARG